MTQEHPITPPPELVQQWRATPEYTDLSEKIFVVSLTTKKLQDIATQAARWGADQELEACCEYMQHEDFHGFAKELRAARRPNPPSLKEQALEALDRMHRLPTLEDSFIIRAALEQLNDY